MNCEMENPLCGSQSIFKAKEICTLSNLPSRGLFVDAHLTFFSLLYTSKISEICYSKWITVVLQRPNSRSDSGEKLLQSISALLLWVWLSERNVIRVTLLCSIVLSLLQMYERNVQLSSTMHLALWGVQRPRSGCNIVYYCKLYCNCWTVWF